MAVFLLLAVVWAAVLVPPALRIHAARQEAFLVSLGSTPAPEPVAVPDPKSLQVHRRRRIAGGLLVAMATTLVMGLLPTFRILLYVHLFLVDSFIAYIALLAHNADKAARTAGAPVRAPVAAQPAPAKLARRRRRQRVPGLAELPPIAPIG